MKEKDPPSFMAASSTEGKERRMFPTEVRDIDERILRAICWEEKVEVGGGG
jgi:hypothetical protein